jgi:hypothetical protein
MFKVTFLTQIDSSAPLIIAVRKDHSITFGRITDEITNLIWGGLGPARPCGSARAGNRAAQNFETP